MQSLPIFSRSRSFSSCPAYLKQHSYSYGRYRPSHWRTVPWEKIVQGTDVCQRKGVVLRSQHIRVASIEAPLHAICSQPSIDSVGQQEGLYTICGSLETGLSRDAVLGVLTDYTGLARIYSSIEESRLSVIGRKKSVLQVCRWEFLVFSGTFETKLTVEEDLPSGTVVFQLVSSSFMRQFEGRWQVSELADGSCKVEHRLSVEPVLAPPQAFAGYTQKIFVRQVERLLEDLSCELCRIQGH